MPYRLGAIDLAISDGARPGLNGYTVRGGLFANLRCRPTLTIGTQEVTTSDDVGELWVWVADGKRDVNALEGVRSLVGGAYSTCGVLLGELVAVLILWGKRQRNEGLRDE